MNRNLFIRPKIRWGPEFLLEFISQHPRKSSTQIKALLLREHGLSKNVPEVHALIYALRKQGKVVVAGNGGVRGGMVYESV